MSPADRPAAQTSSPEGSSPQGSSAEGQAAKSPGAGALHDWARGATVALGVAVLGLSLLPFRAGWEAMGGPAFPDVEPEWYAVPSPSELGEHATAFGLLGLLIGLGGLARVGPRAVVVGLAGCGALEIAQCLVPGRHPSLWDWGANALALSVVGLGLGAASRHRLATLVRGAATNWWRATFAALVIACVAVVWRAQSGFGLEAWADDHELLLGDEADGQRPWRGRVGWIGLYSGVLDDAQAAALSAPSPDRDDFVRVRREMGCVALHAVVDDAASFAAELIGGNSEDALSMPPSAGPPVDGMVEVGGGEAAWRRPSSTAALAAALREGDGFSVEIRCAVDELRQSGPARIATLSRDAYSRNFTLGQDGRALVFRVRCARNAPGASRYEAWWRPVFSPGEAVHLVATYDRGTMRLHVDGVPWGRAFSVRAASAGEHVASGGAPLPTALLWFVPIGIALRRGWRRRAWPARLALGILLGLGPVIGALAIGGDVAVRPALWWVSGVLALGLACGDRLGALWMPETRP